MSGAPPAEAAVDPGSFRDPDSRVVRVGDQVFRMLSPRGLSDWEALRSSPLLERLTAAGQLVASEQLDSPPPLPSLPGLEVAAVLRHEPLPFVSYPYEWPFGMLRDAALLQLDVLLEALSEGLILKDASAYNVQWRGTRPVFVDVGSFQPLQDGEPWVGYRQFCMQFLNPLLLRAYLDVPFQPWLRGRVEGIRPQECADLLGRRGRLRRGVLVHVHLHSRLDRRRKISTSQARGDLRRAGFTPQLIAGNVRGLRRLVQRLDWTPSTTTWTEYGATSSYSEQDAERKRRFVAEVVASRRWGLAWDLGANDASFSRLAAEHAGYVVAVDSDEAVVERTYRELREEGRQDILPLCIDLADPSPGLGWEGRERRPLADRGRPDLVLCLAAIHHLAITANIPLPSLVGWLRGLGGHLVIEFPTEDDEMVRGMLADTDGRRHYSLQLFERSLAALYEIERREPLASGARVLYSARPLGDAAG